MKGGYQIISLVGYNFTTGTPLVKTGIYNEIESTNKAILIEDFSIGGIEQRAAFVLPIAGTNKYTIPYGSYEITINSDDQITIAIPTPAPSGEESAAALKARKVVTK